MPIKSQAGIFQICVRYSDDEDRRLSNWRRERIKMPDIYNVYAVRIDTGERRIIAEGKTERDAEAAVTMAVTRRGVDVEYFIVEKADGL